MKPKFTPIESCLTDGRRVVIREAVKKDANALIETITAYLMQSEHLISAVEEFNPTVQQQERWIEQLHDNSNSLLLVAVYNGRIIGNIDLKGENRKKIQHNTTLGIGILKSYQRIGLSKILMQCVTAWAKKNPAVENIWLNVFETNHAAIALYEHVGFTKIAVQPFHIKTKTGYIANIIMHLNTK